MDGWLARALLAEAAGDRRGVAAACARGLDVLDQHRLTLGASELRARATARGTQLTELAQRSCAGDPRRLLQWSERWRATACSVPAVRPPEDPALRRDLAALREITTRLHLAHERGAPTQALESERARLEHAVRARTLRSPGRGTPDLPGSTRGPSSTRSAGARSSSWWTSTATCTPSCAATAGCAGSGRAGRPPPRTPSSPRG
ncbi:hypothetical protein ACFQV2_11660 [Actinokineospora soli]|uniref:Uncharacterized protein n=1 Tax=Actinokineospora soli TaxID=1048753 RepID=A0ABW2TMQ7_9PSEU